MELTGNLVPEIYTEYWFNDWQEGASNASGNISAISGNMVNHIPYPEHAVVMADAIDWNPRHNGSNHFLFVDGHVDGFLSEKYFDPEGIGAPPGYQSKDRDAFGNHPYWAWGLGKNVIGY